MNTAMLIIGIIIVCILLAFVLLFSVFHSRKAAVPNRSFRIPGAKQRIQNARKAEVSSSDSRKHRRNIVILVIVLAAAGCIGYLAASGFLSDLMHQMKASSDTTEIDSQLLYDGNNVRIYTGSIERADNGWAISLSIENDSVLNLSFNAHSYAVNGIMTRNNIFDMDCDVAAGTKTTVALNLDDSVMEDYGIDAVRCVDLIFWAYDSDTYLKIFDTNQVEIQTSLYNNMHDTLGGTPVFQDDSISVTYLDSTADTYQFCITNETDHYLCFNFNNLQVNGSHYSDSDSGLQDVTLLSGCEILCSLTINSTFLQQNNIDTISSIAWQLSIRPEDEASRTYQTETITYQTGLSSDTVSAPAETDTTDQYYAETTPVGPFLDTDASEYYADALAWAYENGVTSGTSETTFSPEESCTRGQITIFLWRAAGSPESWSIENQFTDVTEADSYYQSVLWALENGITSGTSETTFSPDEQITRAQMILFLWRMAGSPAPGLTTADCPFQDVTDGDSYLDAVLWSVERNIITGTDSRTFAPTSSVSRAQAVTMIYRFFTMTDSAENSSPEE